MGQKLGAGAKQQANRLVCRTAECDACCVWREQRPSTQPAPIQIAHAPMRRGQACSVPRKSERGTGCAGGADTNGLRLGAAAALTLPPPPRCRLGGGASPSLSCPSSSLPSSPLLLSAAAPRSTPAPSSPLAPSSSSSNSARRRLAAGRRRSGASCGQAGRQAPLWSGRPGAALAVRAERAHLAFRRLLIEVPEPLGRLPLPLRPGRRHAA